MAISLDTNSQADKDFIKLRETLENNLEKDEIEEILTLKNDWQQRVFASEVKRYINRTIEDQMKKKNDIRIR